jgi:hypothetical protein
MCCDRQLMIMLLTQYIDNACKYSIFGTTITIRVAHANAEVIFSVHSYGPVIPMADRERIFDRYYRSATYSNRAPGNGNRLSVAKRVALIHGGYVWVTSDEIEGTTFFAAIPAPVNEEVFLMSQPEIRILVVDDESAIRRALRPPLLNLAFRWPKPRGAKRRCNCCARPPTTRCCWM